MNPTDPKWQDYVAEKLRENEKKVGQLKDDIADLKDEMVANTKATVRLVAETAGLDPKKIAEDAANKAAEQVWNQVHINVGKTVVSKFLYVVGLVGAAVYWYLQTKGWKS